MKLAAFVPIKLNSQRLKNKNILPLNSKPMCWYIFDTLLKSGLKPYVFCSDEAIKNYIPQEVMFLKRSPKLDDDTTLGIEIYQEFAKEVSADFYLLAHATSPFVKSHHVTEGIESLIMGHDSALTVQKHQTFVWHDNKILNYNIKHIPRTQDITPVFTETSALYFYCNDILKNNNTRIGENPYFIVTDNISSIDVDTEEDYKLAVSLQYELNSN